jgi:flagellar motor switch protein FliN
MSDWLMNDDDGGGYLGLDEPAMPDAAPAPPSAPTATATAPDTGDWLGGDTGGGGSDDWLGGSAPQAGQSAGASVMDGQGDWMAGEPAVTPGMAPAQQHQQQYASDPYAAQPQQHAAPAPMAMSHQGDMSVMAPQLPQVQPTRRPAGGQVGGAGELSNLVLDVEVQVEVGLGNAALTVEEFLEMGRGSVVELDTPIDAPIELKVRGKLIARGQLVSINGSYGMRIVEMLNQEN